MKQNIELELSQNSLVTMIREQLSTLTDVRTGKNSRYKLSDAALSAFAVFFLQNPSFLAQQINLQQDESKDDIQRLFGAYSNPSDNQIRHLLDAVSPNELYSIFYNIFNKLDNIGYFKAFSVLDKSLLIALDGIEYFSSEKIHCEYCSSQPLKNGRTRYSHKMITAVIVSPNQSVVIPLAPEFITPQDGHAKQDGELVAARRWLQRESQRLTAHNVTILGDDLFSDQSHCKKIIAENMHFILVCKPESHTTLYEWLANFEQNNQVVTVTHTHWHGKHKIYDHYRFINDLPLRDTDDTMRVNWCELKSVRDDGKQLYHNTFITDYSLSTANVVAIIQAGKTRWQIENENTLKTKGYNFGHNFGHGKQNLSAVLATLILIAFLFHTILEPNE